MDFSPILALFAEYGSILVFVVVLLDNAGLPLPGELALLAFGLLAQTGHAHLGAGVVAAALGAMAGDSASYWLGRLGGVRILRTYCRITLGSATCVDRALAYYQRFGRLTIVLGRFVMGLRAFLVPLAGSAGVPYAQFLVFDAIGAFVWSALFIVAGRALGSQAEAIGRQLQGGQTLVVAALVIGFLAYLALKLWKRRRDGTGRLENTHA